MAGYGTFAGSNKPVNRLESSSRRTLGMFLIIWGVLAVAGDSVAPHVAVGHFIMGFGVATLFS